MASPATSASVAGSFAGSGSGSGSGSGNGNGSSPVNASRPQTPLSPMLEPSTSTGTVDAAAPAAAGCSGGGSDGGDTAAPHPRLKSRHRLLQGLQRMSSSPALARLGRTRSTEKEYRPNNTKASLSCTSLAASPASVCSLSPQNSSYSSQLSYGFSTAPTTPSSSPLCSQSCSYFEANSRLRPLDPNELTSSVSVPIEIRTTKTQPVAHTLLHEISEKPLPKRENFNFWADLPYELRVYILSFLSPKEIIRLGAVSKQWHEMCYDGQLWTSLDCQTYYQQITSDGLIKILLKAGAFVRNLNLRGCVQLRDQWLSLGTRMTNQECRNLEHFSIEGCKIERSSIHFFLLRNPKLLHLNMPSMQNINNATMRIIACHCPQLELLNIDWCSQIDTRGLRKVIQSCPNLRDLRASEVRGLDDRDFMLELFRRNRLERLMLQHCDSLTDEALKIMVHGIEPDLDLLTDRPMVPPRRLRHLDISRCRSLTDQGLKCLAHHVPFLEGLRLCQNTVLTDDALLDLIRTSTRLSHVEVEEVELLTNEVLTTIAKSKCAQTMQHLSISYCEQMGDLGTLPLLKSCPNLQSLWLDNTRVSDLTLIEAARQVRQRGSTAKRTVRPNKGMELVVFDCANVTWAGVREVMQSNCRVMVSGCKQQQQQQQQQSEEMVEEEEIRRPIEIQTLLYPSQIIHLKAFYGWQQTVEEHYRRCAAARWGSAARLEGKWAEWMVASEEVGAVGHGWSSRRRRRRAREAESRVRDDEEAGAIGLDLLDDALATSDEASGGSGVNTPNGSRRGAGSGMGRRRARSGGCSVM